jgi:hypothetical protein
MQKITSWSQLEKLALPSTLTTQIKSHLLIPFDNVKEAEELWSELNCQLWFLTAEDDQPQDEVTRNQLTHAVSNPEWEELIGEEYILTLTIVCDDGQGLYLLFHKDLSLDKFQENML